MAENKYEAHTKPDQKLRRAERPHELSRREFLKGAAAGITGLLLLGKIKEAEALLNKSVAAEQETKGEKAKNISFEIYYAYHRTSYDIKDLPERLRNADIFIPEAFGWASWEPLLLQDISEGRKTPGDALKEANITPERDAEMYSRKKAFLEPLYNTHKTIFTIDVPREHPLTERHGQLFSIYPTFTGDFGLTIKQYKEFTKEFADIQKEREVYMLSRLAELEKTLRENPAQFPQLKDKSDIKVLISLGAVHTRVFHGLRGKSEEVSRKFQTMPFVFGEFFAEILRRNLFEKEVSDELAARSILQTLLPFLFYHNLEELPQDSHKMKIFERKMISNFSLSEIKKLFMDIQSLTVSAKDRRINKDLKINFERALKEKGFSVPKSLEEAEKMIE